MLSHLRASLWLLVFSVVLCCVAYPLLLWGIGQAAFRHQAEGSLLDKNGDPTTDADRAVGSRLIAQPFTAPEYFWPRPSAASYNAAASSGSNWGANNYLLRDRVARTLGPIVTYRDGSKKGKLVAPDVVTWFRATDEKDQADGKPGVVAAWATAHSALAQNWVKTDDLTKEYVAAWQKAHPREVADWVKDNPGTPEPGPVDLAVPFFVSYSKTFPGTWPEEVEHRNAKGEVEKRVEPVEPGEDDKEVPAVFFDTWRQANPEVELRDVPADMVMASGSGLDPHITLDNALYQLDRVAGEWQKKTGQVESEVHGWIEALLREKASAPLHGLAGVSLVNVLEVNLALNKKYGAAAK